MTARPQDVALLPLPQELIDALGEYGCARLDGVSEPVRLHRWQLVFERIKEYARANVTAALASAQAREDELRADVAFLRGVVDSGREQQSELLQRNERLAEALRECRSDYEHALGLSEDAYREWCRTGAHGPQPNDTWPRHCQRRAEQIDELLSTNAAQPGETT
ncbi:hypothetical protein [Luteimonas saliphila]|uniref:hypothetical protein n=1 Tax=Luteimonas saliphila TaxID=2804919 RepID=UPI00192E140D|nr:hypothetical protein [Luteimonas saliphila]